VTTPSQPQPAVPAVELVGITKSFPGVLANDRISLVAMPGEVLCLLGENGAGKSTLMGILSGLYQPDEGHIRVAGQDVRIDSPRAALELGIGMVHQHMSLIPTLTVLENLMLGTRPGGRLDRSGATDRLRSVAGSLGVEVDPDALVSGLALGQQQHVEIVKALWHGSRVLILDEPTSMLTPQGAADLQRVLVGLKESSLAIVFITHKLHEATDIGDRVVVLRLGKVMGHIDPPELRSTGAQALHDRIIALMFGEARAVEGEVAELGGHRGPTPLGDGPSGVPVLRLTEVTAGSVAGQHGVVGVSLEVRSGEVLGIAGIDGNGQRALAEVVAGQRPADSGTIELDGTVITGTTVAARQRLGLRYVTDDRLGEGVVAPWSVELNLVLKHIGQQPYWHRGRIDHAAISQHARAVVDEFDIRTPSERTRIGTLSGGNIQKAIIGRELSGAPRLVVFHKPTHGLDVRTTLTVRRRIAALASEGVAVMVISNDIDELLDVCHRIAVMDRGRIVGTVANAPGTETRIGELIVGAA
jgi:simple sugar transport system ATP-binding protein